MAAKVKTKSDSAPAPFSAMKMMKTIMLVVDKVSADIHSQTGASVDEDRLLQDVMDLVTRHGKGEADKGAGGDVSTAVASLANVDVLPKYNPAGDTLCMAYAQLKSGNTEQGLRYAALAFKTEGAEELMLAINQMNSLAFGGNAAPHTNTAADFAAEDSDELEDDASEEDDMAIDDFTDGEDFEASDETDEETGDFSDFGGESEDEDLDDDQEEALASAISRITASDVNGSDDPSVMSIDDDDDDNDDSDLAAKMRGSSATASADNYQAIALRNSVSLDGRPESRRVASQIK